MQPPDNQQPLEALLAALAAARPSLPAGDVRHMADTLLSGRGSTTQLPEEERESYRVAIERFCFVNDLETILEAAGVQHAYRFRRPYPQDPGSREEETRVRIPWSEDASLLGRRVGFPVGVPASVLTADSRWIRYFHDHGFNVITFKTVRSQLWEALPYPNWVFLDDADEPLAPGVPSGQITKHGDDATYLRNLRAFSMANSFGVPSKTPQTWAVELRRAVELLGPDAMLIVSVMGSSKTSDPPETLVDDFVQVARLALEAGAPAIELNLSCPNTLDLDVPDAGVKAPLCDSVADTHRVVSAVADALNGAVPLVAKLGYLPLPRLREMVEALSPHVRAFSGINTFQVRLESRRGSPTFGQRELAGISGIALRHLALDFVRSLSALREELDLPYEILGMGGVMDAADVFALLAAGADAVQTATAAAINPNLPMEIAEFGTGYPAGQTQLVEEAREILRALNDRGRKPAQLAESLGWSQALAYELTETDELDLPRRVVELLVSQDGSQQHENEPLDDAVWGVPPSPTLVRQSEKTASALIDRQREHLLDRLLSAEAFAVRVGWSMPEVDAAADQGDIIYFKVDDELLYPEWQFVSDESPELLPELRSLRQTFGGDVVALGVWIESALPSLNDRSPRQALADGDTDTVLATVNTVALAI